MSNMDELLRRALMEANTLDAEEVFAPPGRSAHYQREQLRRAPVRHAYGSQPNGSRSGGALVY